MGFARVQLLLKLPRRVEAGVASANDENLSHVLVLPACDGWARKTLSSLLLRVTGECIAGVGAHAALRRPG
ncbi:hypothetical protein ACFPRL_29000 [Pseudoclavibacter helvolus]